MEATRPTGFRPECVVFYSLRIFHMSTKTESPIDQLDI